jgi:hypothetical protein
MLSPVGVLDLSVGLTIGSETQPDVKLRLERRLAEAGTTVAYFATRFGPNGEAIVLGRLNERHATRATRAIEIAAHAVALPSRCRKIESWSQAIGCRSWL